MECSINSLALSLLMKHLVTGQCLKTPNFSAFHWSPHGSLVSIGQHFVATRVVHLPKSTETSLITESDQSGSNQQLLQLCTAAQPGPNWTRLCGPCIAVIAGFRFLLVFSSSEHVVVMVSYFDWSLFTVHLSVILGSSSTDYPITVNTRVISPSYNLLFIICIF